MRLEDLSWETARDVLSRNPIGLIPIGAVENHGPHLPLATDWIAAMAIAEAAAEKPDLLILPGCSVGVSEHHRQFWGSLWLQPDLLRDFALGLARAAASQGMRRLVFVNGHGGNSSALDQAVRALRKEGIFAFVFEWWHSIPGLIEELCGMPEDHAGAMETSLVLAAAPDLVVQERIVAASSKPVMEWGRKIHGVRLPLDTVEFTATGVVGDPSAATAEKGRLFIEAAAEELTGFCAWLASQSESELASPGRPAELPS